MGQQIDTLAGFDYLFAERDALGGTGWCTRFPRLRQPAQKCTRFRAVARACGRIWMRRLPGKNPAASA
jgi:hypothetical protein